MKRLMIVLLALFISVPVFADIFQIADKCVSVPFLIKTDWNDIETFAEPIPLECGDAAECWKIPVTGYPHIWILAKNFWGSHGSPSTWSLRLMQTENLPGEYLWVGVDGVKAMMAFHANACQASVYEVDEDAIGFLNSVTVQLAFISGIGDNVPIEELEIGTDPEWWGCYLDLVAVQISRWSTPTEK